MARSKKIKRNPEPEVLSEAEMAARIEAYRWKCEKIVGGSFPLNLKAVVTDQKITPEGQEINDLLGIFSRLASMINCGKLTEKVEGELVDHLYRAWQEIEAFKEKLSLERKKG